MPNSQNVNLNFYSKNARMYIKFNSIKHVNRHKNPIALHYTVNAFFFSQPLFE